MMFGWLFGVILILIVVWYFSQGRFNFPLNNTGSKVTAREALDKRYARGDISKEEYRVARQALRRAKNNF